MPRQTLATLCLGLLLIAAVPAALKADGMIIIPRPPHWPPHQPPHPPAMAPLEVRYHHVNVKIDDRVAVTEIDQLFYNPLPQQLEGTYLFPIPRGAEIDRFSMEIDGRQTEAELLDAEKARRLYEDIVRSQRDPALLEYSGEGLYRVRIFPIPPRGEKHIRLRYTQLLPTEDGLCEYRYPLNTEKFSAAPLHEVSVKVEIESGADIGTLYSPSHEVEIRREGNRRAVIGYEENEVKPDRDFQLFFSQAGSDAINGRLLAFNDGRDRDGGAFLLMLSPRADIAAENILPKDLIFVLDTSGSMAEKGKIAQAKKALHYSLAHLDGRDRFNVVRFATEAAALFDRLQPASPGRLAEADKFVNNLRPIGGTALAEALELALQSAAAAAPLDRPCMIVLITDGKPTIGATSEKEILKLVQKEAGDNEIRIFSFGVGADINTHLLDRLTAGTRAASQYVLPNEEISTKVAHFFDKIAMPVLAAPRLTVDGPVRLEKMAPARLPDLFKGEELLILGRYTGNGRAEITLHGRVNGRQESWIYRLDFPQESIEHDFIPRLWASRRIGFLLDQIRLHGEDPELKEEVIALARQYGILTPYTAYLILEDEERHGVPLAQRTMQMMDDAAVRRSSERMLQELYHEKSGEAAVGAAQSLNALKNASGAQAVSQANSDFQRGQSGSAAPAAAKLQQVLQSQQVRFIANRTFYQNGEQWVDAELPPRGGPEPVRIRFNSDEWFALLDLDPLAPQWLSAGRQMRLRLGDQVYEIVE